MEPQEQEPLWLTEGSLGRATPAISGGSGWMLHWGDLQGHPGPGTNLPPVSVPRPHGYEEPRELLLHECGPAGLVQLVGGPHSRVAQPPGKAAMLHACAPTQWSFLCVLPAELSVCGGAPRGFMSETI